MKKLIILIIMTMLVLSIVNAQEEGFSVLDGVSPDTIWEFSLTNFQKFVIRFNLLSPQVVLGGIDHECSTTPYRVGQALSDRTERRISTTTEVPDGADYVRTELKDLTNNQNKGSIFNKVGDVTIFDNLNPSITYQWFQFACYPRDEKPVNLCGDVGGTCQYNNGANCLDDYSKIDGDCTSTQYACCKLTGTEPDCVEGKSYCFGTGFYGICESGVISDKGQCESKECQIKSPSFGESKSDVCKTVEQPPTTQCVEGKSYCFSSGATFQPATYSICENDVFLDKSACELCLIEHPSFGDTKSAVCADVIVTDTCKFEGKELKLGNKLDWTCSTIDDTIRVRNVVSDIISSENCGFDLEKFQCGMEKFQQKTCNQGQCVLPGEELKVRGILEEQLKDKTENELEDAKCKRTSDCEDGAVCRPFDRLPSIVRERLAGGLFNIAEEGICVIPISDDVVGGIDIASIGCSVADSLGIKGDNKCGLGWIVIVFGVLILIALFKRKS